MAPWRIPAFLGASLTLALYLTCPSPSARAAVESDNPPSNIRFETPSTYCGITDASAVDNAMVTRVRQHSEPEMVVLGLFADCEQKRYWNGDPTKEPTRFGAAFLHKSGNRFKTVTETRTAFLQKLAFRLGSWDRASSRPLFEQMTKGALAIKLQRAQIMAVTGEAVFVGFNALVTPDNGDARMIAGISAFGLIKQLPVSLHLYRNFEHDRTVNTLIPEAMGIMNRWMALNDDSDAHAQQITKQLERPTAPNFDRNLPQLKPARNPERDALLALLQRGEFEMLSRQLANKQVAFEKGLLAESALINAYLAFSSADPGLAKKLDAWIDVQPEHYIPRVARGVYNAHLGWIARGTAYVQKTSYDRLALMVRHFEAATSDFDAALTRNPKISIAWQNLIEMAMARGHPISELYNRGIEEVPSSRVLRGAYAFSFHPDWGGGLEQPWWARWMPGRFREAVTIVIRNMRWLMFHESLQSDSAKFPGLRTVIDSPHYQAAKDASNQADYATAARELIDAVNDGDESRALAEGRQQTAKHNYAAAVRSFDEALREGPSWSDNLKSRANALRGLGYTARSLEAYRLALLDFQQALAVDPYDPELLGDIVMVLWDISTLFPNQASTAFEKLWQDPASCVPHSEPEKRFTVVHMAMPGTPQMTINCTVEALLNRGMFYGRDDFNIREMRGRHYLFAMQSPSRAVKDLAATIEIDDSFPQVWGYYATALHEIGDCRAVAAYQKHIDLCQDGKCPDQLMAISRQRLADLTLSGNCGG